MHFWTGVALASASLIVMCSTANSQSRFFNGYLRDQNNHRFHEPRDYAIEMRLNFKGDSISGSYWYQSEGKDIPLFGKITKDGISLKTDQEGSDREVFQLILEDPTEPDTSKNSEYHGTWRKGKKQLDVNLTEAAVDTSGVRVLSKAANYPKRRIFIEKPVVTGVPTSVAERISLHIDTLLRIFTDEHEREWDYTGISFKLAFLESDILSLDLLILDDAEGAMHPSYIEMPATFDLRTGNLLSLSSEFDSSSRYLDYFWTTDSTFLEYQDNHWRNDNPKWSLRSGELVLLHDDDNAPHSYGTAETPIPFAALKPYLKQNGALQRLLR